MRNRERDVRCEREIGRSSSRGERPKMIVEKERRIMRGKRILERGNDRKRE